MLSAIQENQKGLQLNGTINSWLMMMMGQKHKHHKEDQRRYIRG
jgi:hypothetical protein